jgi:hypothetical protein
VNPWQANLNAEGVVQRVCKHRVVAALGSKAPVVNEMVSLRGRPLDPDENLLDAE